MIYTIIVLYLLCVAISIFSLNIIFEGKDKILNILLSIFVTPALMALISLQFFSKSNTVESGASCADGRDSST